MSDVIADAIIGTDHKIEAKERESGDGYVIRITRPKGNGAALYETIVLSEAEAEALFQVLMETVG